MKKLVLLAISSLVLAGLFSCSEKLPEAEYFKTGYDLYNTNKFKEAIENFDSVIKYYPDGSFAPKAMFMVGYIYSNHMNDLENARKYYQDFLNKYPDHELAKSAEYELATLGKDINDLDIFKNSDSLQASEKKSEKAE